jgi:hypothetical protein
MAANYLYERVPWQYSHPTTIRANKCPVNYAYKTRERERKYVVKENRLDQEVFSCTVQDPK